VVTVTAGLWERAAARLEGSIVSARTARTGGQLAKVLDVRTVQTKALDVIDQALATTVETVGGRLILSMPPQEGKSQRASVYFVLLCLRDHPDWRVAIVSYQMDLARRWGGAIRNLIKAHPEIGLHVSADTAAKHEWTLTGRHDSSCPCLDCRAIPPDDRDGRDYTGGVICTGIEGAITGRPVDMMVIDDPVKGRAEADSEPYRKATWNWWTDSARTRLAPGAPVILIMTRWHEEDLAGMLVKNDEATWTVLNIPAQADHRPEKGETDPLGRQPGEWMESARGPDREHTDWIPIQTQTPTTFAALYQGHPAPAEGILLKRGFWRFYDVQRYTIRPGNKHWIIGKPDEVLSSWDMAFKDTKASDWVVGQIWARWGLDAYLIWQVRERMSFTRTVRVFKETAEQWPQVRLKLVEEKANGAAVMDQLNQTVSGMVPINPTDGKYARAVAVSPFAESRHIVLPSEAIAPWVGLFVDECAVFPNSTYDDQVDTFSQAIERILGHPTKASHTPPPTQVDYGRGVAGALGSPLLGGGRY
jgi:predicted phage terminase large subunit-like protein